MAKKKDKKHKKSKKKLRLKRNKNNFLLKVIILGVFNIATLAATIYILFDLPKTSEKVNTLKNQNLKRSYDVGRLKADLESTKDKYEQIQQYLATEEDFVALYEQMDSLRQQEVIGSFSVSTNSVIQDRFRYFGFPFTVTSSGDWSKLTSVIDQVHSLDFLIRPIKVEIKRSAEGVLTLNYSGFLYVNESYPKN